MSWRCEVGPAFGEIEMISNDDEILRKTVASLSVWIVNNYDGGIIQPYMVDPVSYYLLYGRLPEPEGFLEAVICNKPFHTVVPLADDNNVKALMTWHRLIYNIFPIGSHGNYENMLAWHKAGGTGGRAIPYLKTYRDLSLL